MAKVKTHYGKRWARFCGWALRAIGWTADGGAVPEPKAIILGVPHTSIWDFLVSYLFYTSTGEVAHVMIKKEFFFWPLGPILRACGCIPVDRSSASGMVKSLIEQMDSVDFFKLAIAPEGTRKSTARWKSGAVFIAKEAGVPLYLGYFNWKTKHIGVGKRYELGDDPRADLAAIQEIYKGMGLEGKHRKDYIYSQET